MIVRAAELEEYPEILDMVYRGFKQSQLERTIINVTTHEDPNFQKGDLRIAKADGKIVSMMMLIRRQLRIGKAIVNGAIVAPVATHSDYERKGYCSAVMRNAIQYMTGQGFDITILWGIPWLYPHYGYSPSMLKTCVFINPERTRPLEKVSGEFWPFAESHLEKVTQIYHNNTATRTCAEIRSPTMWEWRPRSRGASIEVLTDKKGDVVGYRALGTDWGRPCAHEVGILNDEACGPVFNSLLETAKTKQLREFYCITHPDHPFARFAFWHDSEMRINRGGGAGMARVLNLGSLLTKMCSEFERRLCHSEFHELECTLKISSDEESAVLEINHGQVSACKDTIKGDYELTVSLACLNPLVTGFKGIKELVDDHGVEVKGGRRALRLIEVLFPTGFPSGAQLPLFWE
ncbi:MAG: GNAT family N-acetyltransferase [Candidatus Bathyarchaeota archaeon]|nr:GNAT family N-acetyltransferase [Candidatus Bathyarchaeota archaeon]